MLFEWKCINDVSMYRLPRTGRSRPGSQGSDSVVESEHGDAVVVDARSERRCRHPLLLALVPTQEGRILLPRMVLLPTALQIKKILIFLSSFKTTTTTIISKRYQKQIARKRLYILSFSYQFIVIISISNPPLPIYLKENK